MIFSLNTKEWDINKRSKNMIYAFSTGFSTRWVGMVTIECFYWW